MITFTFEGKNYGVGRAAYKTDRIRLPDGRILHVDDWRESSPPKIFALSVSTDTKSPATHAQEV